MPQPNDKCPSGSGKLYKDCWRQAQVETPNSTFEDWEARFVKTILEGGLKVTGPLSLDCKWR